MIYKGIKIRNTTTNKMNAPERSEIFVNATESIYILEAPNSGILRMYNEGHTLGQLLQTELANDSRVIHAAYKMEHPTSNDIDFGVKTIEGFDPLEIMDEGLRSLDVKVTALELKFTEELFKFDRNKNK